jgi:hypothetical protein
MAPAASGEKASAACPAAMRPELLNKETERASVLIANRIDTFLILLSFDRKTNISLKPSYGIRPINRSA